MASRARLATLLSMLGAAACSAQQLETSSELAPMVTNTCEDDSDCGGLGSCGPGICIAAAGEVAEAFLEVVPSATAYWGPGDSFIVPLSTLRHGDWNRLIRLPDHARVTGQINVAPGVLGDPPDDDCSASYDPITGSLGVHVDIERASAGMGLPAATFSANAERVGSRWSYFVKLPPDAYDLYATALGACANKFPPVLVAGYAIESGEVQLDFTVSALETLNGEVKTGGAAPASLVGWTLDLVDAQRGRAVSTAARLGPTNPTNFDLSYLRPTNGVLPIVRLSPPQGTVAPQFMWDLAVVDLDGDKSVGLDLGALDLSTVNVKARVEQSGSNTPVAGATVKLRSIEFAEPRVPQGLTAVYETSVKTESDGALAVALLPGRYRVVVIPPDESELAIADEEWLVALSPAEQAGRTLEVGPKNVLRGGVVEPLSAEGLGGITVAVVPSMAMPFGFFERAFKQPPVMPRGASTQTAQSGSFAVGLDDGSYDVLAQPPAESGYPWLVRARVGVPNDGLETMQVSLPVAVGGLLQDPAGNAVQRTRLRVFALLNGGGASTSDGVVQIAEARTDSHGGFRLLLPSQIQ